MKTLYLVFTFPIAFLISLSFLLGRNGAPKKMNVNHWTIMEYAKGARKRANFAKMLHRILYVILFQIFLTT